MIFSRLFLLVNIVILCHFVSRISGHAYFLYPTPRNAYCANSSCTTIGELGRQGPIWSLPANKTIAEASPTSQTTCNGSVIIENAIIGDSYDPGFKGTTAVSWPAGSSQTFQIFVSERHLLENQTIYPSDGWQIRYRDGTQSDSIFSPIEFIYVNVSTTPSIGPQPAIGFQWGQIVLATITVPSNPTNDGIFQFFWHNNQPRGGVMWLSCVDVKITSDGIITISSKLSTVVAAIFIATFEWYFRD